MKIILAQRRHPKLGTCVLLIEPRSTHIGGLNIQSLIFELFVVCLCKGRELNSAATLASQPAAGHSLSFIITIVIMTLGWGLFVGLAAESCDRIWLPCLIYIYDRQEMMLAFPLLYSLTNEGPDIFLSCHKVETSEYSLSVRGRVSVRVSHNHTGVVS